MSKIPIAILGAIPFTFVLVLQVIGFLRALYHDEAVARGEDAEDSDA